MIYCVFRPMFPDIIGFRSLCSLMSDGILWFRPVFPYILWLSPVFPDGILWFRPVFPDILLLSPVFPDDIMWFRSVFPAEAYMAADRRPFHKACVKATLTHSRI